MNTPTYFPSFAGRSSVRWRVVIHFRLGLLTFPIRKTALFSDSSSIFKEFCSDAYCNMDMFGTDLFCNAIGRTNLCRVSSSRRILVSRYNPGIYSHNQIRHVKRELQQDLTGKTYRRSEDGGVYQGRSQAIR